MRTLRSAGCQPAGARAASPRSWPAARAAAGPAGRLPALRSAAIILMATMALASCRHDMFDRYPKRPLGQSPHFANGNASRQPVPDTVPRDHPFTDELLENGTINGVEANVAPFPIDINTIRRGQERFDIYCSPCHGPLADGNGMVVLRGFPQPPSFHSARLRAAPIGHFVHVLTNGMGVMYSYRDRVAPRDRWAIAGYIRALQLSEASARGIRR